MIAGKGRRFVVLNAQPGILKGSKVLMRAAFVTR